MFKQNALSQHLAGYWIRDGSCKTQLFAVNNIRCLVVQYFRIHETKGCLINLVVKLTSVIAKY